MSPIVVVKGGCEMSVERGRRRGEPCINKARWAVPMYDLRVCGVHARAYLPDAKRRLHGKEKPR